MTGFKPNAYWLITWAIIAPGVMAVIFLSYCIYFTPLKYGNVEYPTYAHILGFGMSFASMFWIPSYAVYYIATERGSLKDVSEVQCSKHRQAC